MKNRFLFPNKFKAIGWMITLPCLILGLLIMFNEWSWSALDVLLPSWLLGHGDILNPEKNNLTDELITCLLILGLNFVAFSKEKNEDEWISQIRLESLQWGLYASCIVLFLGTLLIYGGDYFTMMIFNMFTALIFFIMRFNYIIYIKPLLAGGKEVHNEKSY